MKYSHFLSCFFFKELLRTIRFFSSFFFLTIVLSYFSPFLLESVLFFFKKITLILFFFSFCISRNIVANIHFIYSFNFS
uniref:Uncharacterized protein n=1 Tax=Lutzomyia longipalpis TaxID=7200 RepID=A0A7G3B7W6_LUTLO